jgi:hypothetical protein
MSQEWHLRLLEYRLISRKHYCCFSCLRSLTLFYLAPSYLGWSHVPGTEFLGKTLYFKFPVLGLDVSNRFDSETNLLHPSKAEFKSPPTPLSTLVLRVLSLLGLTELTTHPKTGVISECTNLTILNVFLVRLGPMNEKRLVQTLISTQVSLSIALSTFYPDSERL